MIVSPGPLYGRGACTPVEEHAAGPFQISMPMAEDFCAFLKPVPWAQAAGMAPAGPGSRWLLRRKAEHVFRVRPSWRPVSAGRDSTHPRRKARAEAGCHEANCSWRRPSGAAPHMPGFGSWENMWGIRAGDRQERGLPCRKCKNPGGRACFDPCPSRAVSWTFSCAAYAKSRRCPVAPRVRGGHTCTGLMAAPRGRLSFFGGLSPNW